jgi:cell division protein FtsB
VKLTEGATLKSRVQALIRDAKALLGEKRLPKVTKEAIGHLSDSLKHKTWADLEADAEPTPATEAADAGGERIELPDGRFMVPAGELDGVPVYRIEDDEPDEEPDDAPDETAEPEGDGKDEPITEATEMVSECIPLLEKAVRQDGTIPIKVIAPGWGSSGFYSADVLKRDGPKVFVKGLHTYWDHPTKTEEAERPERSLRDLAGVLATTAEYREDGAAGPGLYSDVAVSDAFRPGVEALAPHIGMSIRALGKAKEGEAEGRKGSIVEEIVGAKSVDFVTAAGAGGQILQLFESARQQVGPRKESQVDEKEAKRLTDENAALKEQLARLNEAALLVEARGFVTRTLPADLPEPTKARLVESLSKAPVVKDGKLDEAAYKTVVEAAAKAERDYLATVTGSGAIRGMGGHPEDPARDKAALKEALLRTGLTEAQADLAVKGR